jgi:site-specific recombinase XerC
MGRGSIASRFLESGHFRLHDVQKMLGHANVKTTGIYLNAVRLNLKSAMRLVDEERNRTGWSIPTVSGRAENQSVN